MKIQITKTTLDGIVSFFAYSPSEQIGGGGCTERDAIESLKSRLRNKKASINEDYEVDVEI